MKEIKDYKWFIEKNELLGTITIKADDGASTPICKIATPIGDSWMQNKNWYKNAMRKAEIIALLPQLLNAGKKLLKQIEMSDYSETDGHHLSNNSAFIRLKEVISTLS